MIVELDDKGRAETTLAAPAEHAPHVHIDWMTCANPECRELVIRIEEALLHRFGWDYRTVAAQWIARPRGVQRRVDPAIPEPFRTDFREAAAILDQSARMSAVLSRRILADLLVTYAGLRNFSLKAKIDAFATDTNYPSRLRENLHYLREIGDFGAHTQHDPGEEGDDQARIIDVGREEAEWTLNVIGRLLDYFVVDPAKDAEMRASMDQKIVAAQRKAVEPIPEQRGEAEG